MNAAKYWGKAIARRSSAELETTISHTVWAGSDISQEDADRAATSRAADLERTPIGSALPPDEHSTYQHYPTWARPEPMIDEILDEHGNRVGAVTITNYGAEVLNTESLAFVDVDFYDDPAHKKKSGLLSGLFGKRTASPSQEERWLDRLRDWVNETPERSVRVYRTAAGLRYLILTPAMDPTSEATTQLMRTLEADTQYASLCKIQRCFRARLTPKPWRIGIERGNVRFEHYQAGEPALRSWLELYQASSDGYAVCNLIEEIGPAQALEPATQALIELHDGATGATTGLPLA